MPILHAIILGVTQGLSEFLPISSSGHLLIVPWLFDWTELTSNPDLNKTFDVALHIGTFVGAASYLGHDLATLIGAGARSIRRRAVASSDERLAWLLLVSALPAAAAGAAFEPLITERLGAAWLVGLMLVVFGLVLLAADRLPQKRDVGDFGLRHALLLGVAQAAALQPGVSRSGATISMGRWLGYERRAATRISFLMSLPIIGGAALYEGVDLLAEGGVPPGFGGAFLWGIVASAVTGFLAVWLLLRYVSTRSFRPFVVYRVLAGLAIIAIAVSGWR